MTRAYGPAYPDGSHVVGYFTISGTRVERVAPKEHHYVANGCRCHLVCMTCNVVKRTGTPSLAPCGGASK